MIPVMVVDGFSTPISDGAPCRVTRRSSSTATGPQQRQRAQWRPRPIRTSLIKDTVDNLHNEFSSMLNPLSQAESEPRSRTTAAAGAAQGAAEGAAAASSGD